MNGQEAEVSGPHLRVLWALLRKGIENGSDASGSLVCQASPNVGKLSVSGLVPFRHTWRQPDGNSVLLRGHPRQTVRERAVDNEFPQAMPRLRPSCIRPECPRPQGIPLKCCLDHRTGNARRAIVDASRYEVSHT